MLVSSRARELIESRRRIRHLRVEHSPGRAWLGKQPCQCPGSCTSHHDAQLSRCGVNSLHKLSHIFG